MNHRSAMSSCAPDSVHESGARSRPFLRRYVSLGIDSMRVFLAPMVLLATGCVSTPLVEDAAGEEDVSTVSVTCEKPYKLTQDCSSWSGAKMVVAVDDHELRVAASADGDVILVMDAHLWANSFALRDFFLMNSPTHSRASNSNFEVLKEFLEGKGVKIERVRPMTSFGNIDGYFLELDRNGYNFLRALNEE